MEWVLFGLDPCDGRVNGWGFAGRRPAEGEAREKQKREMEEGEKKRGLVGDTKKA